MQQQGQAPSDRHLANPPAVCLRNASCINGANQSYIGCLALIDRFDLLDGLGRVTWVSRVARYQA